MLETDNHQPNNNQRTFLILNYFIGNMFLYSILFTILIKPFALEQDLESIIATLLSSALAIVIGYLIAKPEINKHLNIEKIDWKLVGQTILMMFVTLFIISYIISALFEPPKADNQAIIESIFKKYPLIMVLNITFGAALLEELTFRYAMIDFAKPTSTLWISSLLFGAIHLISVLITKQWIQLLNLPVYVSLGYFLGRSYLKSKSIINPMLIHFIYNGIQAALMFYLL